MTTTKSVASINGISIAYRDRGTGAVVVFIHGIRMADRIPQMRAA